MITDFSPEQLQGMTLPKLLAEIKATPDFPVVRDMDELAKPKLLELALSFIEKEPAPKKVEEPKKAEAPKPQLSVEEINQKFLDAGFKNKEDVISCITGNERALLALQNRVKELDAREAKIAAREKEIQKIEQLLKVKTGELEAKIATNKVLVEQLHKAKNS